VNARSILWLGEHRSGRGGLTALVEKLYAPIRLINDAAFRSRFRSVFGRPLGEDGLGDCHQVATAFMVDMLRLKKRGWHYVTGTIDMVRDERGLHSWCENNGVVYDGAAGVLAAGTFMVATVEKYYSDRRVQVVSRLNATSFRSALKAAVQDLYANETAVWSDLTWAHDLRLAPGWYAARHGRARGVRARGA
jgi:hypothetical protein